LPEAMGVMVINTALKLGIPIEKTPINKVFKIALVGYSSKGVCHHPRNELRGMV